VSEEAVVRCLLDRLKGLGWHLDNRCPRVVRGDVIVEGVLREGFERLNKRVLEVEGLEDSLDSIFSKVRDLLGKAEPHEFLEYLRGGVTIKEGRKYVKVFLIDFENLDNNEFMMCQEVEFYGERSNVRPDLVLYVNGIPLVVVEVENIFRLGEEALEEGIAQVLRWEREVPQLFKYVQIGVVYTDDENSVYMPMMKDWRGRERLYSRWRDVQGNYNILDLLRRDRLLDVLRWFTFYKGKDKRDKVIPRYNQYWATVRAVNRVVDYFEGRDIKNRGLIWHWQGAGKTYIMFYIAYQFYNRFLRETL
jgi:type I restriction enzyme R subunit